MTTAKTAGGIHYRMHGRGAALTLIHGVGASMESWDAVIAALPAKFRILRYDLRGHGGSAKSGDHLTLEDLVTDLRWLFDHVGWTQSHLVGFSLGGLIAQAFALAYPQQVNRLALISTVAGRTAAERARVAARARGLAERGIAYHLAAAEERWFTDDFCRTHPEIVAARLRHSMNNDLRCYAAAYRVLAESDLANRLGEIKAPTLVMTGENDSGSTPRMARLMARRIPNAKLCILEKLKHSVLLESPQTVAKALSDFLTPPAK